MSKIPEIGRSYCKHKLRMFGKSAGRDAIPEFIMAINAYAEKLAKACSNKCEERGKKVITADDVTIALAKMI